ncbi:MAG: S1 RNA-binding domain-containing protein [Pseudomonadota bacterium]
MAEQTDAANQATNTEPARKDPSPELLRLIDLAIKYPEIGPPLAELAFKIDQPELGHRIVRMGLDRETPGLEYYFVAANAARRAGKHSEALDLSLDALRAFLAAESTSLAPDDGTRLLHLIRLGFATLMFDLGDVQASPAFVRTVASELPRLEPSLGADPFYHTLLAQTLWFEDRERSEKEWERAAELGNSELTWNARGTWYKEAERDTGKAELAYRRGLEEIPTSAILLHNLAQVLVNKAEGAATDVSAARRILKEADDLLRSALREDAPRGLRRHIHVTRDRLTSLRSSLPGRPSTTKPQQQTTSEESVAEVVIKEPVAGDVVRGRICSLTAYGAFVSLDSRHVGLLHRSEMSHQPIADPASIVKIGDEIEVKVLEIKRRDGADRLRISLSRKALLPSPAEGEPAQPREERVPPESSPPASNRQRERTTRSERRPEGKPEDRIDRPGRGQSNRPGTNQRPRDRDDRSVREQIPRFPHDGKLVSLGDMLLAKLREQQTKKG